MLDISGRRKNCEGDSFVKAFGDDPNSFKKCYIQDFYLLKSIDVLLRIG